MTIPPELEMKLAERVGRAWNAALPGERGLAVVRALGLAEAVEALEALSQDRRISLDTRHHNRINAAISKLRGDA